LILGRNFKRGVKMPLFLFYEVLVVVTYPPDPLPLGIHEGKGVKFREGLVPLREAFLSFRHLLGKR